MRHFLLLFTLATAGFGQQLSFGIVGGGTATDAFHAQNVPSGSPSLPFNRFYVSSKDWILGGMAELQAGSRFSVEADGLYRKLHFTTAAVEPNGSLNSVSPSPVITWEFPILVKYRIHCSKVSQFVELGPSFRTTGNLNGTAPSHYGLTAGAGAELRLGRFAISPTVRYTRWASDDVAPYRPRSNPDQVEIFVAFSRGSEIRAHPWGERVSLGVVAGLTLRNDLPTAITASLVAVPLPGGGYTLQNGTTTNYGLKGFLLGPSFEVALRKRLSLELDALYHPLRYTAESSDNGGTPIHTSTFNNAITWEFPVLGKYTFSSRGVAPFAEIGPIFRLPQDSNGPLSTSGLAAGAGIRVRLHRLKIEPLLRYTHWASDRTGSTKNQLEVLVGISF